MLGEDFRNDYDFDKGKFKLGSGSYGTVYRVINKKTKEKRAIKVVDIEEYKQQYVNANMKPPSKETIDNYIKSLFDEIRSMQDIAGENGENENSVKFYGYYYQKYTEIAIVMELCDENFANMYALEKKFNFDEIRSILNQLNKSFKIMHKKAIAHRDLKPTNILVKYKNKEDKTDFILKICDYGEAKRLSTTKKVFSTKVGTQAFMAPEVLCGQPFDLKCDLWSLGVIIYLLNFGVYPYNSLKTEIQLSNEIKNYGQKYFKTSDNKDFDDLVRKLLIADPEKRISWEDYFNHPFICKKEILLILKIEKKELNKNIYFLNDSDGKGYKNEEISNLTKDDCEIFINNKPTEFSKYFKPEKEGLYEIKIIFRKILKNCSCMFSNNDNIIKIDLSSFNISQVTNMYYMFGRSHFLKEVNLSNFQPDKVTNMSYLFNKCSTLKKVIFPDSFNTSNVEDMSFMFNCCYDLEDIHFPRSFVTKKVKNMENMFSRCYKLEKINLENFETHEVTNISYMFEQCSNLKEIIINPEKFKTDKVVKMGRMFNSCESLEKLNILKNFDYSQVKFMNHMFQNCDKLKEIDLSGMKEIKDDVNMNKIFDNLKDVKIFVNSKTIDKFQEKFKDIKFVKN